MPAAGGDDAEFTFRHRTGFSVKEKFRFSPDDEVHFHIIVCMFVRPRIAGVADDEDIPPQGNDFILQDFFIDSHSGGHFNENPVEAIVEFFIGHVPEQGKLPSCIRALFKKETLIIHIINNFRKLHPVSGPFIISRQLFLDFPVGCVPGHILSLPASAVPIFFILFPS